MPYSYNDFTGDGATVVYSISFEGATPGYLEEDHVKVEFDGVLQDLADRSFDTPTQVRLIVAPASGTIIRFQRESSVTTPLVDFAGGSQLSEKNLDRNTLQMLYLTQEAFDVGKATTDEIENAEIACLAAQVAAETAQTAAELAETNAETAQAHAETAETGAETAQTAAELAETHAETAETNAETAETNAAASAAAAVVSEDNVAGIEDDIIAQGDIQDARVIAEGNTQVVRVETEGNTQSGILESIVATAEVNKSVRQTMLVGSDLTGTPSTIETASTKTGDLRITYHDLDMDMLTGSRGGMILTKDTGIKDTSLQNSLCDVRYDLKTNTTEVLTNRGNLLAQFTASGVQLLDSLNLQPANMYAFQTTHKTILDGNEWHYNPTSGFAMCKYEGTGTAFNLQHPMNKTPTFFVIKNLDATDAWVTGRKGTDDYMVLNTDAAEASSATVFPDEATDTYIALSTDVRINTNAETYFLFGWFGDPLDDLHAGMVGERGVTASWLSTAGETVDTGITDIQQIIYKDVTSVGDWATLNKASGFGNFTILNDTDAETTQIIVTVSGSEVTLAAHTKDYLVVVIGSTATRPDNRLKAGTKVLRKVGTALEAHYIHLGAPYSGGDAGGMLFSRAVGTVHNNYAFDTIRGPGNRVNTDDSSIDTFDIDTIRYFTETGVTLGDDPNMNPAELCQYTGFNTTHKATIDGIDWEYNPLTGFGMCKYTGTGVARELTHPMGKKPRMLWIKNLDVVVEWFVYTDAVGATKYMNLDGTLAATANSNVFNDTEPTDTNVTLGTTPGVNQSTKEHILYGWFGDDLSDINTGLTGERGVSAMWQYTGGSGAMSVDTGLDNVTSMLYKTSSTTSNWEYLSMASLTKYSLNTTGVETAETAFTFEGSVVSWAGGADTVEFIAWGSKADSGVDNSVILPGTASEPSIVSMANGFSNLGNIDVIKKQIADVSVDVTGTAGKKFIYMKSDGLLYFTENRPEYKRGYFPGVTGSHVYDIDKAVMYNASGLGERQDAVWESTNNAVIDGNTFTLLDLEISSVRTVDSVLEAGKSYRVRGRVHELTGATERVYLPYWDTPIAQYTVGDFDYIYTQSTTSRWNIYTNADAGAVVELYSIQEVITDQIIPAVFLGECMMDAAGNVYDIKTYVKGTMYESDWFNGIINSVFYEDNKLGNKELILDVVGRLSTGEIKNISDLVETDEDVHKITIGGTLSAPEYKLKARRTF